MTARAIVTLAGLLFAGTVALAGDVTPPSPAKTETATFAGGCFWCEEAAFDALPGVISVTSGYTGGTKKDPTYEEVSSGTTGHAESVEVVFDPGKVSYRQLLDIFWFNVDPADPNGQFCDKGSQYRSAIFYHGEEQHRLAEQSKKELEESKRFAGPIVTQIVPATTFYRAEEHHQHFHEKNSIRYKFYRHGCGRDARLEALWGKK